MLAATVYCATCFTAALGSAAGSLAPPWGPAAAAIERIHQVDRRHHDRVYREYAGRLAAAKTEADHAAVNAWTKSADPAAPQADAAAVRAVLDAVAGHAADPRSVRALAFVAAYAGTAPADVDRAVALLRDHHLTAPEFTRCTQNCGHFRAGWVPQMLRDQLAAAGVAPDRRHRLRLALATHLKQYDPSPAGQAEALEQFEHLVRDRVPLKYIEGYDHGPTIADLARAAAYDIKHLSVGCPAPGLAGDDTSGKPIKLSDYRGKVVVLSFWTTDCSACMALVPDERRIADRFRGRPFAVLGVNGDTDAAKARATAGKRQIPWRSVWCGPEGIRGPIPTAWNIDGWPTVYVIDHTGTIRAKGHTTKKLDALLDEFVGPAERASE